MGLDCAAGSITVAKPPPPGQVCPRHAETDSAATTNATIRKAQNGPNKETSEANQPGNECPRGARRKTLYRSVAMRQSCEPAHPSRTRGSDVSWRRWRGG